MSSLERETLEHARSRLPWRSLIIFCVAGLSILAGLAGYEIGKQQGTGLHGILLQELDELRLWRQYSEPALLELEQQLVSLRRIARIDRAAAEQVRGEVVDIEKRMATLREELAFYRSLMRPAESNSGLGIRSFKVFRGDQANRFQYELVMQQLALSHRLLKGVVKFSIAGRSAQELSELSLKEISTTAGDGRIEFKFKYFERIRGEIELPEGFVPEGINISARAWGRPVQRLEKSYPWLVEGK